MDSHEQQAPFHGGIDNALIYGGIYRDVYIEVKKPSHIEDILYVRRMDMKPAVSGQQEAGAWKGPFCTVVLIWRFLSGCRAACKENKVIEGGGYIQVSVFDGMDNCRVKKQRLSRFFWQRRLIP